MSKTNRRDYRPKNKPSKRYTKCFDRDGFKAHYYEAGSCGAYGHTTRHADNQTLSQLARTKEKRQWKKQIDLEI